MATIPPRGGPVPSVGASPPSGGRSSMDRRTSLDQQASMQRHPTILRVPSRKRADLFDSEDFDPTKLVNQLYPDEASLTDLDKFVLVLKKQINQVDQEIFNAVRSQGGAHARARQDLSVAHGQIVELFTKIRDIQRKSEESEAMVQEICRDIKKLDYAKRHLTNSITALRRLAMLTAAVTDLEAVCDRRDQYRKCANLVEAVHQLMEYFQQYEAIPKVRSLSRRLAAVESRLQSAVLDDLKLLVGGPANDGVKMPPENLERLATACLVVAALGKKVQDQVMDWMCDREMNIYQSAFGGAVGVATVSAAAADDRGAAVAAAHATRLDKFEQRYGWFRDRMKEKREVWGVFPDQWRMPQMLCLTFCKITKAHLKRILSDEEALAGLRSDVAPLIKAVVATNRFERDMAAAFGGGAAAAAAGRQGADEGDDDAEAADSVSASEARRRLEAFRARVRAEQQAKAAKDSMTIRAGDRAREAQEEAVKVAFEGAISEAFEGVLVQFYVGQEERELLEYLDAAVREEAERRWLPDDEEGDVTGSGLRVLQSANKIFFKIRASLTRCAKNVSRGPTLVALAQLFRRVLSGYAADLMRRLPKTATGSTHAVPSVVGGSMDWYVRLSEEDERVVCCLLATAEFCRETTEGLAGALAKDVKTQFADRVDFGEQEGAFVGVASACMNVLVLGINSRLDGPLLEMTRMRWDSLEAASGDDSPFVNGLRKVLLDCAPRVGAGLDAANLSFLCDKIVRMFVPRLHEAIFRLRRVADKGMMQLAIDMDAVRRALLEFPRVARAAELSGMARAGPGPGPGAAGSGSPGGGVGVVGGPEQQPLQDIPAYTAYVEREMGSVVALVKVLQSRPEQLVDTYLLLMPPAAQSLMEFQRLCELKALSRKQQSDLMGSYQLKVGQLGPRTMPASGSSAAEAAASSGSPRPPGSAPDPGCGASGAYVAGSGSAYGGVGDVALSSASASNLGSLKASVNMFTRELAASIPFAAKRTGALELGGAGAGGAGAAAVPGSPALSAVSKPLSASLFQSRTGSSEAVAAPGASGTAVAGAFFKETAAKTKEGFARFGNLIRSANTLTGSSEAGGLQAPGGGGGVGDS
ncbi:hypothetical protein VaNZ11_005587 [Volvox africanus]|uniref:Vps53 N-terminal domain-containing protein n=1 Tax=Volvox africanus TaxID=51714 RepID=A0ABQ5S022_9CHLO|nr:hypothetical protein VaNZ11_005587 [Volvox africanus]